MSTLIVGCGYLGRRVGRLLASRGECVFGTTRSEERAQQLVAWNIEPHVADVLDPDTLEHLPAVDRVLYCVGFDRTAGIPLRTVYVDGLRQALERLTTRSGRVVFASSTGVYGQDDGGWVDEDSPTEPRHESGRVALDAEDVVRRSGIPSIILRFSGLYGPGRIVRREALLRGEPIGGDPQKYLNLVHIDDAAQAAAAALERGNAGRIYVISDDRPIERREYYTLAAECLGAPPPRFVPVESPREVANKRVSNRRMKEELIVTLEYPDIRTGVPAALLAETSAS